MIGMTIVMLGGGIDLSVGSSFALANLTALALINVAKWPLAAAIAATVGVGALVGLVNGFLIGFLRLRAFLTTLVMMTLIRAIFELLLQHYSVRIASSDVESDAWDFIGSGSILGAPISFVVLVVVAIVAHVVLSRLRIGWRITAVGGSRRAAYNAGIPVRATVCLTYVVSGVLTSLAGTLYAARLSGAGPDTGLGLELIGDDRGAAWRQQHRRRPRLGRQGADGRDHRLAADQWPRQARTRERRVLDGGRLRVAARHRHRRAMGQMAT